MDWNHILQLTLESVASIAGVLLLGAVAWLTPLAKHWLEVQVGKVEAQRIEDGLALAVRVTETRLGLSTPEEKKAFCVAWAQNYFDEHDLKLDAGAIGDRVEAALLAQKMQGLNPPVIAVAELKEVVQAPPVVAAILPLVTPP